MTIKKTLGILAGATLCLFGSFYNSETFNRKIGEEQVRFYEDFFGKHTLEVIIKDGSEKKYYDFNNDSKIDSVKTVINGKTANYHTRGYNYYLDKIGKSEKIVDYYVSTNKQIVSNMINTSLK